MHVPHEAMEARYARQRMWRPQPIRGDGKVGIELRDGIGSRVAAHQLARAVKDLQCHWPVSGGLQVVIEDRTIRWILPGRYVGWQRGIGVGVPAHAQSRLGREQEGVASDNLALQLPQGSDVIQDPESTAVS